jgi:hypothetical protein
VRRNQGIFGADIMTSVVVPVLGGTAGFVLARYLGNMLAMRDMGTSDPKIGKTIAAVVGIPAVFLASRQMGAGSMLAKNSGAIVLGMGMASAEAWLRDTPLLGGSPAAAAVLTDSPPGAEPLIVEGGEGAPAIVGGDGAAGIGAYYETAASGLADYYSEGMLGGLGAQPGNQGHVDNAMNRMESVSTVIPTDLAMKARGMPQFASVREPFVNQGDRGHAGGLFARQLFSGMTGG